MNRKQMTQSRRDFLRASALGLTTPCLISALGAQRARAATRKMSDFTIRKIERTTVRLPYRPAPRRAMERELPHWRYIEVFQVHLLSGAIGVGETTLYYTWGATEEKDVQRAQGKNAVSLMWDDSLGAGLQMALFDAVAKTADIPLHRLLGTQVHETTPLSWWNIDMAVDDLVSECLLAKKLGYMSFKTKGRPWFDLWKQVESVVAKLPAEFKLDMDYNDTLLNAKRAIPILKELEQYPQIDIYETPIPQADVPGNRAICKATRVHVAMHYGTPDPVVAASQKACDGFVIGGGASRVKRQGSFAETAEMPFWLQLVGTGITAAFSLHFGAVSKQAVWPAVNCHQLYQHDLLKKSIQVRNGHAGIPTKAGLGLELDYDALEKYRVSKPPRRPDPARMILTTWPDGRKMYTANTGRVNFMLTPARFGKTPYFQRGVDSKLLPDDGSAEWKEMYAKSRKQGPVLVKP